MIEISMTGRAVALCGLMVSLTAGAGPASAAPGPVPIVKLRCRRTNPYQLLDAASHHRAQMANVSTSMPGIRQYCGLLHRFSVPETLLGRSGTRYTVRRGFSLRSLESRVAEAAPASASKYKLLTSTSTSRAGLSKSPAPLPSSSSTPVVLFGDAQRCVRVSKKS